MGDQAHDFLIASGKLQALCYKEEIESALRTPGMAGFQLLDLHDFPGQGTALVGVLDPFWDEKGYITARQFRRFCNSTVPLARLDQTLLARRRDAHGGEIRHRPFRAGAAHDVTIEWKLIDIRRAWQQVVHLRWAKWRSARRRLCDNPAAAGQRRPRPEVRLVVAVTAGDAVRRLSPSL